MFLSIHRCQSAAFSYPLSDPSSVSGLSKSNDNVGSGIGCSLCAYMCVQAYIKSSFKYFSQPFQKRHWMIFTALELPILSYYCCPPAFFFCCCCWLVWVFVWFLFVFFLILWIFLIILKYKDLWMCSASLPSGSLVLFLLWSKSMCGAVYLNSDFDEVPVLVQERTAQLSVKMALGFFVILALLLSIKKCKWCYHMCSGSCSHLSKCRAALVFYL